MLNKAWRRAVERLRGDRLVEAELRRDAGPFAGRAPAVVLALGKAAAETAHGAWLELGMRPRYVLAAPGDAAKVLARRAREGASVWAGEHPEPGKGSLAAGEALLRAAREAGEGGVLGLVSGGGSALACAPVPGLTLEDKQAVTRALLGSGAAIEEVNAVRRHLSRLKGGGLARALGGRGPALVLVLSDAPRGGPEAVSSGPFAPDPTTFAECVEICRRRGVWDTLPAAVCAHLDRGARREVPETLKAGDPLLHRVEHRVLAGPADLARAAAGELRAAGLERVEVRQDVVTGEVEEVARAYAAYVTRAAPGSVLVAAGEPALRVSGPGVGGRAQHLALLVARELLRSGRRALFLCAGSDGRDGPTDHAGALVGPRDFDAQAERDLAAFDSAAACARLRVALPRRHTGINLCDLHVLAVQ